jgi:hypothetical protein
MPKQESTTKLEKKPNETDDEYNKRVAEDAKNKTTQLLEPRIIEIQIN